MTCLNLLGKENPFWNETIFNLGMRRVWETRSQNGIRLETDPITVIEAWSLTKVSDM